MEMSSPAPLHAILAGIGRDNSFSAFPDPGSGFIPVLRARAEQISSLILWKSSIVTGGSHVVGIRHLSVPRRRLDEEGPFYFW